MRQQRESFEDGKFLIPAEVDDDLTTMYGDYMHPPKDRNAFIQHLDEEDRYQDS